jgi:hypothetical protein
MTKWRTLPDRSDDQQVLCLSALQNTEQAAMAISGEL